MSEAIRAIDSLVNSSFLGPVGEGGLGYLFRDIKDRPRIESAAQLLEALDAANIGACVVSIMEPDHAEWVGAAHAQYPKKILPAMIVNPLNELEELRHVVANHAAHGVR